MRPLKYRAYIKEYDKIIDVDRLGLNWDGSVQEIIVSEKELEGKDEWTDFQAGQFELMELTGYLDSDDNDVYSGQIIECGIKDNVKVFKGFKAVVVWGDNYKTYGIEHHTEGFCPLWHLYGFKIIGSIYQDKELLND